MAYAATISKRFNYIKIYAIKKSLKGNTNAFSRFVEQLLQKYMNPKGGGSKGGTGPG